MTPLMHSICTAQVSPAKPSNFTLGIRKPIKDCYDLLAFKFIGGVEESLAGVRALIIKHILLSLHKHFMKLYPQWPSYFVKQLKLKQMIRLKNKRFSRSVTPSLPHPVCSIKSYEISTALLRPSVPIVFPTRLVFGYCEGSCEVNDIVDDSVKFNLTERYVRGLVIGKGHLDLHSPGCIPEGEETENLMVENDGSITWMKIAVSPTRCMCS